MRERGLTPTPPTDRYREWAERYKDDPVGFVTDCIRFPAGQQPAPYQLETLAALAEHDRAAARGVRGLGKTALAAWVIHHWALVWEALGEDWKIVTTASNWRQLTRYLWPEIRLWARRIRWNIVGRRAYDERREMLRMSLKLEYGSAFAVASNDPAATEGAHAKRLLYVFDEAKIIPPSIWDSAEGAFATGGGKWLAVSTAGLPSGRFFEIHAKRPGYEHWWTRHVTWQEAVAAGRVDPDWVETRRKAWGEQSLLFKQQVMSEFAADEEGAIIPLAWVEAANERWLETTELLETGEYEPDPVTAIGVDVGGGTGGDKSVIALVRGKRVDQLDKIASAADPSVSTMELAGRIGSLVNKHNCARRTFIDSIGIGAGVVHRLRERDYPVSAFNAAQGTTLLDEAGLLGFANWRSAGWWTLREILDPARGIDLELPPDDDLMAELTAPRLKRITSREQRLVESKEDLRKANRLGRSTDCADAVIHALVGPVLLAEWERAEGPPQERTVYEPYAMPRRW